jgi:hypothetical protein
MTHVTACAVTGWLQLGGRECLAIAGAGVAEPLFPCGGVVGPPLQLDAPQGRLRRQERTSCVAQESERRASLTEAAEYAPQVPLSDD